MRKPAGRTAGAASTSDKISNVLGADFASILRTENILLLYTDGYTISEIAGGLKLSAQTVKNVVLGYLERSA